MGRKGELWKHAGRGAPGPKEPPTLPNRLQGSPVHPTPPPAQGLLTAMQGRGSSLAGVWSPALARRQKAAPSPTLGPELPTWEARYASGLSSVVLEEGALQEGGQLRPVILQGGKEAWGDGEAWPTFHTRPAWPRAPYAPRGQSRSERARQQGPGHCRLRKGCGQGCGGRGMRPLCGPGQPPPRDPTQGPQHTWQEVISELPVQPVLQYQQQSELGRQEGKVSPVHLPCPAPTGPHQPGALLTCQRALSSLLSRLHCIWITWGWQGPRSPTKA